MFSRSHEEGYYRRGPPGGCNEFNRAGHFGCDEGDYSCPPRIYGRENAGPDERYPRRADYGYRDSGRRARGGDVCRSYAGRGSCGGPQGGEAGPYVGPAPARRGERCRKCADEFSQWRSGRSRPDEESRGKGEEVENPGKGK